MSFAFAIFLLRNLYVVTTLLRDNRYYSFQTQAQIILQNSVGEFWKSPHPQPLSLWDAERAG